MIKILIATIFILGSLFPSNTFAYQINDVKNINLMEDNLNFDYNVRSAYLMEASTGTTLFSKDESEENSIASVTKVMTLLLVMEALDEGLFNLDDKVMISKNAASTDAAF